MSFSPVYFFIQETISVNTKQRNNNNSRTLSILGTTCLAFCVNSLQLKLMLVSVAQKPFGLIEGRQNLTGGVVTSLADSSVPNETSC